MNFAADKVELFDVMKGERADDDVEVVDGEIDVFDCALTIFDIGAVSAERAIRGGERSGRRSGAWLGGRRRR
jgi:hypothetical protein